MNNPYLIPLQQTLDRNADVSKAVPMQNYMKGLFDFYGIKSPDRQRLLKDFFVAQGLPEKEDLWQIIQEMWEQPQREWHYCAIDLLLKCKKYWKTDIAWIKHFEWMTVNQSWWDSVDLIASNLIGLLLKSNPAEMESYSTKWAQQENVWLKRVSIIFQLKYKDETNQAILFQHIVTNIHHPDFFIRKAIGWALRQYAKFNPDAVLEFIEMYEDELSPLSKREALKHF